LNECFTPIATNISSFLFLIYNRWGALLFETNEPGKGWCVEDVSPDVYFYVLHYTGINGETGSLTGNVTLLK
jgi:hypothetical protein